jgi:hypothetical protein
MKRLFFLLALLPVFAFGQYSEKDVKSDSSWYFIQKNACDTLVWWEGKVITLKDGTKFQPLPIPVGWNDKIDCSTMPDAFIKGRDTAQLYAYFANTQIIDPGRQQARAAQLMIYENQFKRSLKRLDQTFINSKLGSLFKFVEKTYGDQLLGTYKYVTIGADGKQSNNQSEIIKRQNGNYALRVGQNTFNLNIYGDEWIEITGLPGSKAVSLFRVGTKERWASPNLEHQIVSNDKFIIDLKTIK